MCWVRGLRAVLGLRANPLIRPDHICKKRGLLNPKDWALVVRHNDSDIVVPLDRTVDSLGDEHDLILVRRTDVAGLRGAAKPQALQNNNPSGESDDVAPRDSSAHLSLSHSFHLQAPFGAAAAPVSVDCGPHFKLPAMERPTQTSCPSRPASTYHCYRRRLVS